MAGIAPTAEQLAILRRHGESRLALAAAVARVTARHALAGLTLRRAQLRALLEAATRLDAAGPRPRPSGALCGSCNQKVFRRGLCRSHHRKLSDAGIALPPDGRALRAKGRGAKLRVWLKSLPPDQLEALRAALAEVA